MAMKKIPIHVCNDAENKYRLAAASGASDNEGVRSARLTLFLYASVRASIVDAAISNIATLDALADADIDAYDALLDRIKKQASLA
jgi:hypothetical protein